MDARCAIGKEFLALLDAEFDAGGQGGVRIIFDRAKEVVDLFGNGCAANRAEPNEGVIIGDR